jgi:multiple sugar transport system ATP-binding protein
MAGVVVQGVEKAFGSTKVIHGINVDITDGEFVVLVGPSGCGKSTLLRMIAGLEEISGGSISIGNREVNRLPPKDRDVAMVFQNYALYPHMTVYDNMAFSLKLRKAEKSVVEERVKKAADILNLAPYLQRYPRQLSGGQRQRVAMGRAIVRDPQVFLFDEPLSNLDAKLRVQMRIEIKALHQRLKTTTIYVTHDQIEAMTMADRIVVMHDGIVEQIGTPLELYDHPANLFVAGFIGSPAMNFVPGTLRRDGGATYLEANGGRLALPIATKGQDGQKVQFGIRPEHLAMGAASADSINAHIEVVEPTGADTHVVATAFGQQIQAVFTERHHFAPGSPISLKPRPEAIHIFDAASGRHL